MLAAMRVQRPLVRRLRACSRLLSAVAETQPTQPEIRTEDVKYPPVKGKYPAGEEWGDFDPEVAWELHEEAMKMREAPSVLEKYNLLLWGNMWKHVHKLEPWRLVPNAAVDYVSYVTKSHVISDLAEEFYAGQDKSVVAEQAESVARMLESSLNMEYGTAIRDQVADRSSDVPQRLAANVLRQLVMHLTSSLARENPQLLTCRIGPNVKVKSFFKRYGWNDQGLRGKGVDDPPLIRIQASHRNTFHVQIPLPLPEVVPLEAELVTEVPEPEYNYKPSVAGQFSEKDTPFIFPGHWVQDPCQFSLVSFNLYTKEVNIAREKYGDGSSATQSILKAAGISSGFSTLMAQAFYLGFPFYQELPFPLTHQTVVCDGSGGIRLLLQQLNTTQLHKPPFANPRKNLCWMSDNLQLWSRDEDTGRFTVDAAAMSMLVRACLQQGSARAGVDMRPHLQTPQPEPRQLLINTRDPELSPDTRDRIHKYLNT